MFGRSKVDEVTVTEAASLQAAGAVLLDVREDEEWAAGHAPDALHISLSNVGTEVAGLAGKSVLTICRSGARSARAAKALVDAGVRATNVAGGMNAWASAGLAVVRDDGTPGVVA